MEERTERSEDDPCDHSADGPAAGHRRLPAHHGAVRRRRKPSLLAVEQALAGDKRLFLSTQRNAQSTIPAPTRSTRRHDGDDRPAPQAAQRQRQAAGRGHHRARVLEIEQDDPGASSGRREERSSSEVEVTTEVQELMNRVGNLFERFIKHSPGLPYETMLSTVRISEPGRLADTIAAHLPLGSRRSRSLLETTSPGERLEEVARHPRLRDREAARGQEDPQPGQEADGEGAEGVLPQREDQGDPAGAGTQGRPDQRGRRVPRKKIEKSQDARRGQGQGDAGAEAASRSCRRSRPRRPSRATTSSGCWRCRGASAPASCGHPQAPSASSTRTTTDWTRSRSGSSSSSPCASWSRRCKRLDPLLRRAARRRQDLAGQVDRPRHGTQVRAAVAGRRARRGRDPRPPADLHRRVSRADHPDDAQGRHAQPGVPARRGGQDGRGLPRRSVGGAARGARPRAEPHLPRPLPGHRVRPQRRDVHRHRQRDAHDSAGAARTAWRSCGSARATR